MRILDLDPLIAKARGLGEVGNVTYTVDASEYDRVAWTGPDGARYEGHARVQMYDYTPMVKGRI